MSWATFPGPYVNWLLEAAGGKGLAAIAYALNNRAAKAECCVAYWDGTQGEVFRGVTEGEILVEPRGEGTSAGMPGFSRGDRKRRSLRCRPRRRIRSRTEVRPIASSASISKRETHDPRNRTH